MPGKSDYFENAILNAVFRNGAFPTLGTSLYVGLHTADPTDAGTGTEVTGGAYARAAVARNVTTNFAAPTDNAGAQRTSNSNAITFPAPTANWGTVTYIGIWDAASGGNLLYSAALATSRTINNGDGAPSFAAGALTIDES
jgi:hypothetical protein